MIVNVRGTSGSGKSFLVRRITELYTPGAERVHFQEGRKQPLAVCHHWIIDHHKYALPSADLRTIATRRLFVPGHYNSPCGGCDTIKTPDEVYSLVNEAADRGEDVLYEGIMIGDDVTRCVDTHKKYPGQVAVIGLTTDIKDCLAGIQARRDAKGNIKQLNPKNTIDRANRLKRHLFRLQDAGVKVYKLDREEAFLKCKELFQL